MGKETVVIHNKTDKPDNVVKKENEIFEECQAIQRELPGWLRGFYMYLNTNVLPMTRLSYLREVRFFFNYLINEHLLSREPESIKDIKAEDLAEIRSQDVNLFIDYCRRYEVDKGEKKEIFTNQNAALSHKKSVVSVFFKYLYRDGYVPKNITDGFDPIRLPKPGEREIKHLED
ncbi:MAG: recombinase, partial [Firmicutes bacterium]|nr:recombinase [Bacillota bacterium]